MRNRAAASVIYGPHGCARRPWAMILAAGHAARPIAVRRAGRQQREQRHGAPVAHHPHDAACGRGRCNSSILPPPHPRGFQCKMTHGPMPCPSLVRVLRRDWLTRCEAHPASCPERKPDAGRSMRRMGQASSSRRRNAAPGRPARERCACACGRRGSTFSTRWIIQGRYQSNPALPFTPGVEVAGEVIDTGPGAAAWHPGAQVIGLPTTGSSPMNSCCPEACHAFPMAIPSRSRPASRSSMARHGTGCVVAARCVRASGCWCSAPAAGRGSPRSTSAPPWGRG